MRQPFSTSQALDVFLRGFSTTRSFIKPFPVHQLGSSLWMLADADFGPEAGRVPEIIAYGAKPEEVLQARERLAIERHFLCVLLDDPGTAAPVSAAYKQLGYRRVGREPLFVLNTENRVRYEATSIRRITQPAEAEAVAKAARSRQIFPPHLTEADAVCRLYAAFDGETPVGWVRSVRTHPDCSWVSNLFVQASHRRQGLGKALMSAMLDDDFRFGVRWSVLTASLTGAKLYPNLGYEERGLLLAFSPRKTSETG